MLILGIQNLRLLLPNIYFDHHLDYRQYSVYSDRPVNRGVSFMMREVTSKLEATELYTGAEDFRIFLCYDPEKYAEFAREVDIHPDSQGFTIEFTGDVFINLKAIGEIGQNYGNRHPYSLLSGSATHIIAHELSHVLITNKLGYFDSRDLPAWIREGYVEYAASKSLRNQDTTYSFKNRVSGLISGDYKEVNEFRRSYLRYAIPVEYLLDVKGMSFDDLVSKELNPAYVTEEMHDWYVKTTHD